MDVVDRLLGGKKAVDGNGHLPADAGLITDAAMLTSQRTPWQSVQLARELKRPHSIEVIDGLFEKFQELHGDRGYRDDPAVVGGIAELDGVGPLVVVAQQRGATTEENIARSFGMPYPEGYRKAIRLYRMAEKFHLPLVTLVDTPGAYPGPEAEERGQAEAIAKSILVMTGLQTPIVAIIIGEGGSGGALALAVGDVVLALENAIYSVISPEGAAAILWRTNAEAEKAAAALKLTAHDLLELKVVDGIVPEPPDGAHTDPDGTAKRIGVAVREQLERLVRVPLADILTLRYERFRAIGVLEQPAVAAPAPKRSWWRRLLDR
jgi:acetyl-CoA carboxylase carboxyl transferase subunit alpha